MKSSVPFDCPAVRCPGHYIIMVRIRPATRFCVSDTVAEIRRVLYRGTFGLDCLCHASVTCLALNGYHTLRQKDGEHGMEHKIERTRENSGQSPVRKPCFSCVCCSRKDKRCKRKQERDVELKVRHRDHDRHKQQQKEEQKHADNKEDKLDDC